ncbi:MAG: hypothetical protein JXI33_04550 [Candidatus Aminicenantes bacterium]|nr:hypothetical protein [Candidatus Aminicenantes bacterium]
MTDKRYQEEKQDESQRDVGPLKLAGRAILLAIQYRIGVKKINKSNEDKKIEQVDEKNLLETGLFHEAEF